MKKILSLVLALMILAMCPAMAETAVLTQTLTSPNGDYSFDVPADFIPMDADLMVGLLSTPEMQQVMAEAMGLADASQLAMYFEVLEASNMMIVIAPDMVGNLNVQTAESALTMELVALLKTAMDEAMIEQYLAMGCAEEDIRTMDIQEIAGRKWYGVQLVMAGMSMQSMLTVENGIQYTMTFTEMDADMIQAILESFKVTDIAE